MISSIAFASRIIIASFLVIIRRWLSRRKHIITDDVRNIGQVQMRLEVGMKKIPDWILALLIFFLLLFAVIGIHYSFSSSWKDDIRNAGYEIGYEEGYQDGYLDGESE